MAQHICAVDVGTRSARAAIFAPDGRMLAREARSFDVSEQAGGVAEYRFETLWQAACDAVRAARETAGTAAQDIAGLAFDATCSLVLPVPLGPDGQDTIAWYDHRAAVEAAEITATGHDLIRHLGGSMSPEMQTAKLLWVKRHRPDLWPQARGARDLVDALTGRACGSVSASASVLATKWPYLPDAGGWQTDLLTRIGLDDLALPETVLQPGSCAGRLTEAAAAQMGLTQGLRVGTGMVDAYAGALGASTGAPDGLCLIAGTSNCVMALSDRPTAIPGIWGPFRDAVLPGLWASEGGQSAAGAALDFVIDSWPGREAAPRPDHPTILHRIADLRADQGEGFARGLHVLPDFNGNRSPLADPLARGVIHGLPLDRSFDALCALYWRTAVGIALGTRQILSHMGVAPGRALTMGGGMALSDQMTQLFADATGHLIVRQTNTDAVLRGTAMVAAVASGLATDLAQAGQQFADKTDTFAPQPEAQARMSRDYAIFEALQEQRRSLHILDGT